LPGWSLWSKDIIFLVTHDSVAGPKAWVDAYHSVHSRYTAEDLSLLSGALQGAVCFDYPFDHRFETLHIAYDGINGQLPNLDLFNTAVSIASGQMGIGTSIQGMHKHDDSYYKRLLTLIKGMSSQAFGHATGPHSVFMPYHVDAITLTTIGQGWQDEMALGRTVESICRSLNNLLEHFHQSFFFYLLMQSNRFVSIGTYLPSAMAVAAGFTIMAIHLWVKSGQLAAEAEPPSVPDSRTAPDHAKDMTTKKHAAVSTEEEEAEKEKSSTPPTKPQETTTPSTTTDRQLALPLTFLIAVHLLGLVPLYLFTLLSKKDLPQILVLTSAFTLLLPMILASALPNMPENVYLPAIAAPTASQYMITKSLSLLLLGLMLSALATLNFSLSMTLGLLAAPLAFVGRVEPKDSKAKPWLAGLEYATLAVASPVGVVAGAAAWAFSQTGNADAVVDAVHKTAFGWNVWSSWGVPVGIWCVWWPAWVVSAVLVASSWYAADSV
jgi:glycosylphosphatidylinositol transamidase